MGRSFLHMPLYYFDFSSIFSIGSRFLCVCVKVLRFVL